MDHRKGKKKPHGRANLPDVLGPWHMKRCAVRLVKAGVPIPVAHRMTILVMPVRQPSAAVGNGAVLRGGAVLEMAEFTHVCDRTQLEPPNRGRQLDLLTAVWGLASQSQFERIPGFPHLHTTS